MKILRIATLSFLMLLGIVSIPEQALAQTKVLASCGTNSPGNYPIGALGLPLTMDQTGVLCVSSAGGGGGGTSSTFGAAFPATGTAAGFNDGTNMVGGRVTSGALADAFTPPTSGLLQTQAFPMWWNGATFDRAAGDATNGLFVNIKSGNITGFATSALQTTQNTNITALNTAIGITTDPVGATPSSGTAASLISLAKAINNNVSSPVPACSGSPCTTVIGAVTLFQGTAALSATNGIFSNILQGNAVLSTGNPLFAQLTAGSAIIGKFGIDQTTPGTTNLVALAANQSVNVAQVNGVTTLTGTGATGTGAQRVTVSTDQATNAGAALVKGGVGTVNGGSDYETVAASQTAQALGATGATGDYLSHCVLQPTATAAGTMTILDNATVIYTFTTGTLSNLASIPIPIGALSVSGAWKVTTGANETVTCFGKFT